MLDAYIIDRIRREREQRQRRNVQVPLHIDDREHRPDRDHSESDPSGDPRNERGSTEIDFHV